VKWISIYVLPGAVLQSVMVGGGYGTGRELVEFFTRFGIGGGLLGMLLATSGMAAVVALSYEIARRFSVYDYRSFFRVLLGPVWPSFEVLAGLLYMLVLAVIGAAAGNILESEFALPRSIGIGVMLTVVVVLTFFGRDTVTRALTLWSVALYAVFGAYFVAVAVRFGDAFVGGLEAATVRPGWATSGFQYLLYNVAGLPVLLYAARAIETRRQAIVSGALAALIAMVPGLLFHLSFAARFPVLLDEPLPVYAMMALLNLPLLKLSYLIVLFGTFIETGAGAIQGFIERLDTWRLERGLHALSRVQHATLAAAVMALAGALSAVGIVSLIADGYGTIAWGFLAVYLIPLFTVGIFRLRRAGPS
jgi:uncharacterized membrane protein YkvI